MRPAASNWKVLPIQLYLQFQWDHTTLRERDRSRCGVRINFYFRRSSLPILTLLRSIIAVPGLGSHALGSWKSTNSDEVWLRDFLPRDLTNIRVLLYGYDTILPGSLSKQSIEDLGSALLEQVNAFREHNGVSGRLGCLDLANA